MEGSYIRADFDKKVQWKLLDGWQDDQFDVLGDGSVKILFTPGHTPGHQSLLVEDLKKPVLLAADACYTTENLHENVLPGLCYSPPDFVRSIERMRHLAKTRNIEVVVGHDPVAWTKLKHAPEYIE